MFHVPERARVVIPGYYSDYTYGNNGVFKIERGRSTYW